MNESVDAVAHAPGSGEGDLTLLERVRAGDDGAYDELYRRHVSAVRRFAMSLRRPPIDADDVVGEVFLRVLRAIRAGHGPREYVRTYLLTVVRRVVHEWAVARRDEPMGAEQLVERIPQQSDHQSALVELELLARAFDRLPQRWREVLWRTEVEGYRPATLADQFGLTPNATAVLALRARRGLRRAYLRAVDTSARSGGSVE